MCELSVAQYTKSATISKWPTVHKYYFIVWRVPSKGSAAAGSILLANPR